MNRLLSRTNFIIAYDMSGNEPRMTSVVILGSDMSSSSAGTPQIAPTSNRTQKPMALGDDALEKDRAIQSREQLRQRKIRAKKLQILRLRHAIARRRR